MKFENMTRRAIFYSRDRERCCRSHFSVVRARAIFQVEILLLEDNASWA
jgi:hypothetical protein